MVDFARSDRHMKSRWRDLLASLLGKRKQATSPAGREAARELWTSWERSSPTQVVHSKPYDNKSFCNELTIMGVRPRKGDWRDDAYLPDDDYWPTEVSWQSTNQSILEEDWLIEDSAPVYDKSPFAYSNAAVKASWPAFIWQTAVTFFVEIWETILVVFLILIIVVMGTLAFLRRTFALRPKHPRSQRRNTSVQTDSKASEI